MNIKSLVIAAAFTGVLAASASALTVNPAPAANFVAPAPAKVVNPTGLLRSYEGTVVNLALTVDANGQPSHISVVSPRNCAITPNLVAAVSQWRFTPARKDGVAVPAKIVLPLELVDRG